MGRGSWRIRTAVNGFADRRLNRSSKEPDCLQIHHESVELNKQRFCACCVQICTCYYAKEKNYKLN